MIVEEVMTLPVSPKIHSLKRQLMKKIGDCVMAIRKSLTAKFMMK